MPSITGISISSTTHIDLRALQLVDRHLAIGDAGDDLHRRIGLQHARDRAADHRRIIAHHHARGRGCGRRSRPAAGCDHSSPTWSNLPTRISSSNGFMMYSCAPLVIASLDRRHLGLGRAEHHRRLVRPELGAQLREEIQPVHHRHVPVEQHAIRHLARQASSACWPSPASATSKPWLPGCGARPCAPRGCHRRPGRSGPCAAPQAASLSASSRATSSTTSSRPSSR